MTTKKKNKNPGKWVDALMASVGRSVRIETADGIYRDGRCTGFRVREITVNGEIVGWPIEVELNGDPNDRISLDRVIDFDTDADLEG